MDQKFNLETEHVKWLRHNNNEVKLCHIDNSVITGGIASDDDITHTVTSFLFNNSL